MERESLWCPKSNLTVDFQISLIYKLPWNFRMERLISIPYTIDAIIVCLLTCSFPGKFFGSTCIYIERWLKHRICQLDQQTRLTSTYLFDQYSLPTSHRILLDTFIISLQIQNLLETTFNQTLSDLHKKSLLHPYKDIDYVVQQICFMFLWPFF